MGQIYVDTDDLTYEVLYTASVELDYGTDDTPPYHEWEYEIDEIKIIGEYGDGQEAFLSDLPQEIQDEIDETINEQIAENIG
mgnify:CR=1 FL=1